VKRVILPISALSAFMLSASSFAATSHASTTVLTAQVKQLSAQTKKLEREVSALHVQVNQKSTKAAHKKNSFHHPKFAKTTNIPWSHFVTVTTTPFNNKKMDFDGADVLYNAPSINEDLLLLQQKQKLQNEMAARGYALNRPILQLSGAVQGELYSNGGFGTKATDGVSLSTAELDMNAIASPWATAFMSLNYSGSPISTGNRMPNSNVYLSRGFLTLGNLNHCPVYFSAGLMYVPFGRYSTGMIDTPLTQSLAKTRTPAVLLGFSLNNGLFGSVYGYSGSRTSGGNDLFKQSGVNIGLKNKFAFNDSYQVSAGWISNIADSEGQQLNGLSTTGTQFAGFAAGNTTNNLTHNVNGVDANGSVVLGPVTVLGEYVGAAERYATSDMVFNSKGAEPTAMHAEVDYLLPFFAKKYGTSVGVSYGHTWEALALNLPRDSYAAFVNTSLWRETQESLEFRHDNDYSAADTASGRGATTNIAGTGKSRDSVLAQVSVFF